MADITRYLEQIMAAVLGEEVRGSIHDAIEKINDVSEKQIDAGTAISAGDLAGNYPDGSLYINTADDALLRCNGMAWSKVADIRGNGIEEITGPTSAGLTDTYTIHYTDGTSTTFAVNNGNKWNFGTAVSGMTAYPTIVATLPFAVREGDCYLNKSEDAVYHCVSGAAANAQSTWQYDFVITSSGTGTNDYVMLINQPFINGHQLTGGNFTNADLDIDSWLTDGATPPVIIEKSLAQGTNKVTFSTAEMAPIATHLTNDGWAVKPFFNPPDGVEPPALKKVIHNADGSVDVHYSKVKPSQTPCLCKLRIIK